MDTDTLKWCEEQCREMADFWTTVAECHEEDTPERDRCNVRAIVLNRMAKTFRYQYAPPEPKPFGQSLTAQMISIEAKLDHIGDSLSSLLSAKRPS